MAKKQFDPAPSIMRSVRSGWSRTPRAVKLVGYVGTIAGAIYAVSQAAPIAEPYAPAHRYYVREIASPLFQRVIGLQLAQNDSLRQRLIDEAAKRELELASEQAKQLPQYRALVQQRVERIKHELKTIDEQNATLFNERKLK